MHGKVLLTIEDTSSGRAMGRLVVCKQRMVETGCTTVCGIISQLPSQWQLRTILLQPLLSISSFPTRLLSLDLP